jgi:cystathionine beta-lyase/cystathionine gamma-synthase
VAALAHDAALADSLADLADDFDELLFLCRASIDRLDTLASGDEAPVRLARSRHGEVARRLLGLRQRAAAGAPLGELEAEHRRLREFVRRQYAVVAAYRAAGEWQSPPFRASAGDVATSITPHWDDYKRDRHSAAADYERTFVAEMVDGPADARALLTSCGMAAFTTVLGFLLLDGVLARGVVAGSALYHETKLLLARATAVDFVDEGDLPALLRAIRERRPGAVFLDSVCNTRFAPRPELEAIVREVRSLEGPTYLVVDNTGLATTCQPLAIAGDDPRVRAIVFESLLKYHQLGLDRANAGVIVARAADAERLDEYREHLGTNVGDVAALSLPPPRRAILERRLCRIFRNASAIAARLGVRHIGGGCVSLALGPGEEQAYEHAAVAVARRRGVPLVGGSSFGFDVTRVYLTAARAACGEPFVRIAAGTEHRLRADAVADVLAEALERVRR